HWRRLLSRRYNQSAILAHSLSKINNIPTWADALQRNRHTAPQGHKNARDRHANVKNVFSVSPQYEERIKGKNIVLIDDVLTTGATVEECTHTLLKAGAAKVNVLTIARIVKAE
ncbi:MAG: phosphoribosyltransferase family protein, partial [Pseudomonadota bacterium]